MGLLSFEEFDKIYQKVLTDILTFWSHDMQEELSLHCTSWRPNVFDFSIYLDYSAIRYFKAYQDIAAHNSISSVCDVGGFWGVFPVTMRRLGYRVTMTETLKYYSSSFNPLFDYINRQNVQIIDYDPFNGNSVITDKFDAITVMAVLEHYPHSLKPFITNIVNMLNKNGILFLEVPNIAYWHKRLRLLRGYSPLANLKDIYESNIPFIGHHHEFTMDELKLLAALAKLTIHNEYYFNYSFGKQKIPLFKYFYPSGWRLLFSDIVTRLWPNTSECIAISCAKRI